MKGIKNENDGKKSLHGIPRNGIWRHGIRQNGKTPGQHMEELKTMHHKLKHHRQHYQLTTCYLCLVPETSSCILATETSVCRLVPVSSTINRLG